MCVNLGLTARGRSRQFEQLRQRIERLVPADAPLIIAGDFNDWHWRHKATHEFAHPLNMHEVFELLRGAAGPQLPGGVAVVLPRPHLRARLPGLQGERAPRAGLGAYFRSRGVDDRARADMTEFVGGNRLTLLHSGREYFPALESAFDEARLEIHLETYIFEDDVAGQRIARALSEAARRGVATYVMVDGYGSRRMNSTLVAEMESSGVRFRVYRPDITPWKRPSFRRMHRKLAVVDSRVAFVGGINVIDDMHTPRQTPPRFDYAVRVEGPLLEKIHPVVKRLWALVELTQFAEGWLADDGPDPDVARKGDQRAALLVRDNLWHRNDIEEAYLEAIAQARSEILIANAYFFPGIRFRHALTDAAARGVRVGLLLQARVEYVLLRYASRALYGSLLEAGIEIREYHKSFLHAKVAVVDRRWATVGSSNIDPFSLLLAREANIVVDDERFAGELHASLTAAMAGGAREVEREYWSHQPLPVRAATWLAYGVSRLLTGVFSYGPREDT